MDKLKSKIENVTHDEIDTSSEMKIFKDLYLYGNLNKDSKPLSGKKMLSMAKQLGLDDCKILNIDEYVSACLKNNEPTNCIIFVPSDKGPIGHWTSSYTQNNTIYFFNSLGNVKTQSAINRIKRVRNITANSKVYQNNTTSNCGWLALLHLVAHAKPAVVQKEA